jgi:gentisate 1,2-dioxygenase
LNNSPPWAGRKCAQAGARRIDIQARHLSREEVFVDTNASTTKEQSAAPGDIRKAWAAANVSPLWENRAAHNNADRIEPACIWRWSAMVPLVEAALAERSMEAVERRVLSLVSPHSPAIGGAAGTTLNLNAGLQILKPGESARPHRHSMNALRFVLSGKGATTVVDGKACEMSEGDLVTTPGWCWHEHIHKGEKPIVWLDVLDASLHRYLGTDAFQPGILFAGVPVPLEGCGVRRCRRAYRP